MLPADAPDPALLPCPFCGAVAEEFGRGALIGPLYADEPVRVVHCTACYCGTDEFKTPGEAIAAWNRRARPALPTTPSEAALRSVQYALVIAEGFVRKVGPNHDDAEATLGAIRTALHDLCAVPVPKEQPLSWDLVPPAAPAGDAAALVTRLRDHARFLAGMPRLDRYHSATAILVTDCVAAADALAARSTPKAASAPSDEAVARELAKTYKGVPWEDLDDLHRADLQGMVLVHRAAERAALATAPTNAKCAPVICVGDSPAAQDERLTAKELHDGQA
ncbi:MAG: Lar family restriction alleviation protein [Gemmatimonadales bacterium]|jgi:hypothetical protein